METPVESEIESRVSDRAFSWADMKQRTQTGGKTVLRVGEIAQPSGPAADATSDSSADHRSP